MEKKYSALRIIGMIYKVAGVIIAAITVLVVMGSLVSPFLGMPMGRMPGGAGDFLPGLAILASLFFSLLALVYGGVMALTLYALGEGIYLLLALEENTRATAQLLRAREPGSVEAGQ